MAYRNPAFFFYHAARESAGPIVPNPADPGNTYVFADDRCGELFTWATNLDASGGGGGKQVQVPIDNQDPLVQAIDTLILCGHNMGGSGGQGGGRINAFTQADVIDLLSPDYLPTEDENGTLLIPLTDSVPTSGNITKISLGLNEQAGGSGDYIIPELSELWFTTRREMSRGPEANWQHPWRRSQTRFVNPAGVSSTWLTGAARKQYRLTWRNLFGTDRQILLDMKEQTSDWSFPFWFLPPDDAYPLVYVELDRDSDWQQDFMDPLIAGTSDRVTLPLIEVVG